MCDASPLLFMIELAAAELIFLYPAERGNAFGLRCVFAIAACIVAAVLAPQFMQMGTLLGGVIHCAFLFLVSIGAMGTCFRLQPAALFSCCADGYAVEHIACHVTKLSMQCGFLDGVRTAELPARNLTEVAVLLLVYLAFLFTIGRYSARNRCCMDADKWCNVLSVSIILICIGLTQLADCKGDSETPAVSLLAITATFMALIVQLVLSKMAQLQYMNDAVNLLLQKERQHYEQFKKAIDTINIKYHDLQTVLSGCQLPEEGIGAIRDAVRIYGSQMKTGNEALDILLTESSLRLQEEGITLTYMGNGSDLSFMSAMDVYTLFGNAVNNAVEAVRQVQDPEKRVISIVTERKGDLISIGITNYFIGSLTFEEGLPQTTKAEEPGFHGFGMRSMQLIAEKHGGGIKVTVEDDVFDLGIFLVRA